MIKELLYNKSIDLNEKDGTTVQAPKLPPVFETSSLIHKDKIKIPRVVTLWVAEQRLKDELNTKPLTKTANLYRELQKSND